MDADTIVVGGGVVGLWTAYHLANQEGSKTILFEQFPYPHTRGSSHGQSRITRTSYAIEEYSAMMPESHRRWKELENYAGEKLLVNTGLVTLFDLEPEKDDFHPTLQNLEEKSIDHHIVNAENWKKKFPGFVIGPEEKAIFESEGGILRANKCLVALQNWFKELGGELHDGEQVVSLNPINDSKVEVKTSIKTYTCKSVVLACGAYINTILSTVNFKVPIKPIKTLVCYWKCKNDEQYSVKNGFPAVVVYGKENRVFYSVPSYEYPGLIKICDNKGPLVDPHGRDEISPETKKFERESISHIQNLILDRFTDVDATSPALLESCMFIISPDHKYILDFHPKYKNIVFGTGFSATGFKTSPSVGRILASMASGKPSPYSVKPFSLRRLDTKSNS